MPQSCTKLGPVQRRNLGAEPAELGQAGGQADGIEPLTLRFQPGAAHPDPSKRVRQSRIHPDQPGCSWISHTGWSGAVRLNTDQLDRTPAESCPRQPRSLMEPR